MLILVEVMGKYGFNDCEEFKAVSFTKGEIPNKL